MNVTQELIEEGIRSSGIMPGNWVFVHSSLKSLGWVEGGAPAVISAFRSVLGPDGLLITPSLSFTTCNPEKNPGLKAWNRRTIPSRVGRISDTLWRMPEAARSNHPTHSVAAVGKEAKEYVSGHSCELPVFSLESPYMKHVRRNATLVFIGVPLGTNTTLHAFEEWIKLPYLETAESLIEEKDGKKKKVTVTGFPSGCRGFYNGNDTHVGAFIEQAGLISRCRIAEAEVMTVPALDLADVMFDKLYDEPDFLLCRKQVCEFCTQAREKIQEEVDSIHARYNDIKKAGVYRGDRG